MEALRPCSGCRMPESASNLRQWTGSSKRSIRLNPTAWAWVWPSLARLSRRMAAVCGPSQTKDRGQVFCLACLPLAITTRDAVEQLCYYLRKPLEPIAGPPLEPIVGNRTVNYGLKKAKYGQGCINQHTDRANWQHPKTARSDRESRSRRQ